MKKADYPQVAVVTGAGSGIGRETALCLCGKGITVYDFSRHGGDWGGADIRHIGVDVTEEESVNAAVARVEEECGGIDILVNCAGFGISGAVEFTSTEAAKKQFDVNFFGMFSVTRAVLPVMRKKGRGRIVNISSVASVFSIPFQAFYSASKAAIDSFSSALANEVRPYGITVTVIRPGDTATGFTAAREKIDEGYGGRVARSVSRMEKDERNGMSAAAVGAVVARRAVSRRAKPFVTVGFSYKFLCFLFKILPASFVNRVLGRMYAK